VRQRVTLANRKRVIALGRLRTEYFEKVTTDVATWEKIHIQWCTIFNIACHSSNNTLNFIFLLVDLKKINFSFGIINVMTKIIIIISTKMY